LPNPPRVSVIMPNYNKEKYIGPAIQSVLNQTFRDFELIVVDDASTDGSSLAIQTYVDRDSRVRLVENTRNQGVGAAMNSGIKLSKGPCIAFLGSDDVLSPRKLELQVDALDKEPNPTVIYCDWWSMDQDGKVLSADWVKPHAKDGMLFEELLKENFIIANAVIMVPSVCFEKVGLFDPLLVSGQDYDLVLKLARNYPFKFILESLYGYRIHSDNSVRRLRRRSYYGYKAEVVNRHLIQNSTALTIETRTYVKRKVFLLYVASRQYRKILRSGLSSWETFRLLVSLPLRTRRNKEIIAEEAVLDSGHGR